MSLAIDVELVTQVLLADGWHDVAPKTFSMDAYEFLEYPDNKKPDDNGFLLHGGGQSDVCATGFVFVELVADDTQGAARTLVSGPLTSVLAVRYTR